MNNKEVLLICNDSNTVINFRKEFIIFLKEKGYSINVIVGDKKREKEIRELGVSLFVIEYKNRSINPFAFLSLKSKMKAVIKKVLPAFIITFQAKPNIVGSLAAKKCRIQNLVCVVEGLGDPFQPHSFLQRIISRLVISLYKKSFKVAKKVVFLNQDDEREFIERGIIFKEKAVVINGIGIDTKKYLYSPTLSNKKVVCMFSRLLVNKGIFDFCKIASMVRKQRKDIVFELYGEESELTSKDIEQFIKSGDINYYGYTNDVPTKIENSRLVVSTSYREGFSRVLLESMAIGRPIVCYDVVGNKDSVINGETGFVVKFGNLEDFAEKILLLIDNEELIAEMSKKARTVCEKKYDSNIINSKLIGIMEETQHE